ncbi:alpha/beta fold hydrolase, partial [Streptococcus sobrinus]
VTTGPASINPRTGNSYGMTFPVFTYLDVARLQHKLIEMMGITKLHTVIGPSAGGMISLNWAVHYPHMMERVVG